MKNRWLICAVLMWYGFLLGGLAVRPALARQDLVPLPLGEKFLPGPLVAAGDEENVWVCRPVATENGSRFTLYVHPVNRQFHEQALWLAACDGTRLVLPGMPVALAFVTPRGQAHWGGVLLVDQTGAVNQMELTERTFRTQLSGQHPVAALGCDDDLLVLATGPEALDVPPPAPAPLPAFWATPASAPATSRAATGPASAPATTTAPARQYRQYWNLLVYHDGRWAPRACLGLISDNVLTPGAALPVLAMQYGKVIAAWVNGAQQLIVRRLDSTGGNGRWSAPAVSSVPVAAGRIWPVTLGPRTLILWAVQPATNANGALRGGALTPEGQLDPAQMLPPMDLGRSVSGPVAQSVAVVASGNLIRALFTDDAGNLVTTLFSSAGQPLEAPMPVEPLREKPRDGGGLASFMMAVLVSLLAIALWQWQQKQPSPPTAVPARVARVNVRLAAALIDMVLPVVVVFGVFQFFDFQEDRWSNLAGVLADGPAGWSGIFTSPELLLSLAAYLLHVTVGELFWGRSLGKRLCHLRVIALDGSKPTALSILVRNAVRVFEMMTGVLLIFMVISPARQRLGDLLARTMVISEKVPAKKNLRDSE